MVGWKQWVSLGFAGPGSASTAPTRGVGIPPLALIGSQLTADTHHMIVRTLDVHDADGQVVGTVTVPPLAQRRLWKETVKITWDCRVHNCQEAGTGPLEEVAVVVLKDHLADVHGLVLPPESAA